MKNGKQEHNHLLSSGVNLANEEENGNKPETEFESFSVDHKDAWKPLQENLPPLIKDTHSHEEFGQRYDTKKIYLGLRRHVILIALSMLFFGAIAGVTAYNVMNTYQAEAIVLFQDNGPKSLYEGYSLTSFSLSTVLDMIKMPANYQSVQTILGLDISPQALNSMVEVPLPHNESNMIRIIAKGDNPNLVVDIANTVARVAVKNSQQFTQKQLQQALDNFKNEVEITRKRLFSQLQDIENFKKSHQYFDMTAENSVLLTEMSAARNKLQEANLLYTTLLVEYENLKRQFTDLPEQIPFAQAGQQTLLQKRINSLESAIADAQSKYTATNPKVQNLQSELKDLYQQLANQESEPSQEPTILQKNPTKTQLEVELIHMQGKVRAAQKRRQDIAEGVARLDKDLEKLPGEQVGFAKLLQAKQITEEQMHSLNKSLEATQLLINVPRGSLELYQLANKAKPIKEGSLLVEIMPILGLIFGLGVGLGLAAWLEMNDSKLRTAKQINLAYNIPCVTLMPLFDSLNKNNAEEKTLFFIRKLAERIEQIGKNLNLVPLKKGQNLSIAFTSSFAKEGKSSLAYHLALYYGRLGLKVILIDFDWRKNIFIDEGSASSAASLPNFLRGKSALPDIILKGKLDKIKLAQPDPGMKELIKNQNMAYLWETLKTQYDIIIVDTPGILEDDYAANIAALADMSLFVINSSKAPKRQVDQSLQELSHLGVRPCGIILNQILSTYITDGRIKLETKRNTDGIFQKLAFWRKF